MIISELPFPAKFPGLEKEYQMNSLSPGTSRGLIFTFAGIFVFKYKLSYLKL
jgi:hypothetical protein